MSYTRGFTYEHQGVTRAISISIHERLVLPGDEAKEVWKLEEGEEGRGVVDIAGELFEKWFTCIEP